MTALRIAVAAFRALQRLLPGTYRRRHGKEAAAMFARVAREAAERRGLGGLAGAWVAAAADLIRRLPGEYVAAGRSRRLDRGVARDGSLLRRPRRSPFHLLTGARSVGRGLVRRPLSSGAVVLTLGLATGATASIVAIADAVLVRPLPYRHPERLYNLVTTYSGERSGTQVSWLDFIDVRDALAPGRATAAAYRIWQATLTGDGEPAVEPGLMVASDFLGLLGLAPALGRFFTPDEDVDGHDRVVVLGWGLWLRRFAGDPEVVGRTILVDGSPHVVVGVAPERFPRGLPAIGAASIYRPLGLEGVSGEDAPSRGNESFGGLVRLSEGVPEARVDATIARVMEANQQAYPDTNLGQSMRLEPLREAAVSASRPLLRVLLAAVAAVLLIAVSNVVGLMLARAADRRRELALRAAMGAGRSAIVSLVVLDSLALACAGGVLGGILAISLTRGLLLLGSGAIPLAASVSLDGRVLALTGGLCVLSGLAIGLIPGLHATRGDLTRALQDARTRGTTAGLGGSRLRRAMVFGQVAASVVLVVTATLLARSLGRLVRVDPGFDTSVVTFRVSPTPATYPDDADLVRYFDEVLGAVRAVPGVEAASTVGAPPMSGATVCGTLYAEEEPHRFDGRDLCAEVRPVSPDYLEVMGIPLLEGRAFTAADDSLAPDVGMVSRSTAELLWPDEDPIGKRFSTGLGGRVHEVVGVVPDVKQFHLDETTPPQTYLPDTQWPRRRRYIVVRASVPPASIVAGLRRAVWSVDDQVPVTRLGTLGDAVGRTLTTPRFRTIVVGSFAALALVLSMVGLYGVVSGSVASRRDEMAIRMSLGARPVRVVGLIVSEGGRLVIAGTLVGLALSLAASRLLSGLLFGVSALDPLTFIATPLVVVVVAGGAMLLPAVRATRIDPAESLRHL